MCAGVMKDLSMHDIFSALLTLMQHLLVRYTCLHEGVHAYAHLYLLCLCLHW